METFSNKCMRVVLMSHGDFVNQTITWDYLGNSGDTVEAHDCWHVVTLHQEAKPWLQGRAFKNTFTDKLLSTTLLLQAEIHDSFSVGLIKNGVTTCLFLYQH